MILEYFDNSNFHVKELATFKAHSASSIQRPVGFSSANGAEFVANLTYGVLKCEDCQT